MQSLSLTPDLLNQTLTVVPSCLWFQAFPVMLLPTSMQTLLWALINGFCSEQDWKSLGDFDHRKNMIDLVF